VTEELLVLSFAVNLKELLHSVETTGGSPLQKTVPPPNLVVRLKSHFMDRLREYQTALPRGLQRFLELELNQGSVEEAVRIGLIHLSELGITDEDRVWRVLRDSLEREMYRLAHQEEESTPKYSRNSMSLDDAVVTSLDEIWDGLGTELTGFYTYAEQRFLITWEYGRTGKGVGSRTGKGQEKGSGVDLG
jgi:hypothetical protein